MINELPKQIICEDTLFTLGAIDENGDGYYLSADGGFIRANDLYVDDEILDENGIPHYDEYALNGLYFEFDYFDGSLNEDVREMLSSPNCQILTEEMRRFIIQHEKKHYSEKEIAERYDFIIENATKIRDIKKLVRPCSGYGHCCMYGEFDCTECMIANYFYEKERKQNEN